MLFVLSSPLFCSTNAMRSHECCEAPQATLSLLSTCSELFYSCFQPLSRITKIIMFMITIIMIITIMTMILIEKNSDHDKKYNGK